MTLKQKLTNAAEYVPDLSVPSALVADALQRAVPRRSRPAFRLAAALLTACVAMLFAARPVFSPPVPKVVQTAIVTPTPAPVKPRRVLAFGQAVKLPVVRTARVLPARRPHRHFRRLLVRRVAPKTLRFSPRRLTLTLTASRPAETPVVKLAPIAAQMPPRRIVPIVVARLSEDGRQLILLPAAVVISPAAPTLQKE